jgi:hypothetical protein
MLLDADGQTHLSQGAVIYTEDFGSWVAVPNVDSPNFDPVLLAQELAAHGWRYDECDQGEYVDNYYECNVERID